MDGSRTFASPAADVRGDLGSRKIAVQSLRPHAHTWRRKTAKRWRRRSPRQARLLAVPAQTAYLTAMAAGQWAAMEVLNHDDIVVHMADPLSGRLEGKTAITEDLISRPVMARMDPAHMRFARRWKIMCADDERVTAIMEGGGPTVTGDRYDQTYCEIFRFQDGKIIEMHAFMDTALVERCLFDNPLATPRPAGEGMRY